MHTVNGKGTVYMRLIKKLDGYFIKFKNNAMRHLSENNDGMGVVEVLLIIVVLVGLVLIFKTQITNIVNSIFKKITSKVNGF